MKFGNVKEVKEKKRGQAEASKVEKCEETNESSFLGEDWEVVAEEEEDWEFMSKGDLGKPRFESWKAV